MSYLNELTHFPSPELALVEPNGLLAVGGDLSTKRLLEAYYNGIFPWFNPDDPILWWSPDPRAVFIPKLHFGSKSLIKALKKTHWRFTINHAFADVITACAQPRSYQQGTWISSDIKTAYFELHQAGYAHSIEVWDGDELVGGLYGIPVGSTFCGESMFHRQTNASKAAFAVLNQHLAKHHFELIDAQVPNDHLTSLGATILKRQDFLCHLKQSRVKQIPASIWQKQEVKLEF
nr:leucyl/phenylalanyl-tRNA--protein transferase [Shewanella gaetbuli]